MTPPAGPAVIPFPESADRLRRDALRLRADALAAIDAVTALPVGVGVVDDLYDRAGVLLRRSMRALDSPHPSVREVARWAVRLAVSVSRFAIDARTPPRFREMAR